MPFSSDNFTALIYLKNKVQKWKNIAFLMLIAILFLIFRISFENDNKNNIELGNYIANITIEGTIIEDDYRDEILEKIAKKKNIKAVIVNINSPGGGIVGSEILYNNLKAITQNKPIVVLMGSLAASGGYMAAIASDYIIARNGTLTGSIGVIMQTSEITELANKIGIKFLTYKSSTLKGSPSPFEKSNPQVDKAINNSIKDSYNFFADLVKKRRNKKLNQKNVDKILDGRIFTGRQALKNGLIDEVGGKKEALNYLKNKHKIDIEKLSVKNIELTKPDDSFLNKLINEKKVIQIISKTLNLNIINNQIMSIWQFPK